MLEKLKKISIFVVISIYILGIFITFSGDLIQQLQIIRHQNQIQKNNKKESIVFTLKEWNHYLDISEIKYKNNFYDVVSIKKSNSNIIVNVVKDDFENKLRITFLQLLNKHKIPLSEKKKAISFSKHFIVSENKVAPSILVLNIIKLQNYDTNHNLKTNSYIKLLQKPPC